MARKSQYNISPANKWCLIRSNDFLRLLLTAKRDELKVTHKEIATGTGLNYLCIRDYFNGRRTGLTQYGVVKLADYLGYELKLDITVKIPKSNE